MDTHPVRVVRENILRQRVKGATPNFKLIIFNEIQIIGGALMAYTPELSFKSSCTLRRIAWALNTSMTKAIERVFDHLPKMLDREKVCKECQDKTKCDDCVFNNEI